MNAFKFFLHLLFICYLELTTEIFVFLAIWQKIFVFLAIWKTFLLSVAAIIICFSSYFCNWSGCLLSANKERTIILFCWENKNPDTSVNFTVKSRHLLFLFRFSQIRKETSYFDHFFIFQKKILNFPEYFEINWYIILIEKIIRISTDSNMFAQISHQTVF